MEITQLLREDLFWGYARAFVKAPAQQRGKHASCQGTTSTSHSTCYKVFSRALL